MIIVRVFAAGQGEAGAARIREALAGFLFPGEAARKKNPGNSSGKDPDSLPPPGGGAREKKRPEKGG